MAKRTIYVSETSNTLTAQRSDVDELKRTLVEVFREYKKLTAQQQRFNSRMEALSMTIAPWSIHKKDLLQR